MGLVDFWRLNGAIFVFVQGVRPLFLPSNDSFPLFRRLLFVDLFEGGRFLVRFPLLLVIPRILLQNCTRGNNVRDHGVERNEDKVDEAGLVLGNLGRFTVTQEGNRQILLLFNVSLMEKLLEEKLGPLDSNLERSRLGAHISCVYDKLEQLLFGVEFGLGATLVDQLFAVGPIVDPLLLHQVLYVRQIFRVTCHVCGQDYADEALAERFKVIPGKILQKVVLRLVKDRERLRRMIVLLH